MEGEQIPIKISNHVSLSRLVACLVGILEAVLVHDTALNKKKGFNKEIMFYCFSLTIKQIKYD